MDIFYTSSTFIEKFSKFKQFYTFFYNTSKFTYKSFNESHSLTNLKNKQIPKISINNLHEDF